MDLKQLQYFVACAQTGSFSDAAKLLYSTQPSVSKVIKALEDALGIQLFERLPRGIRLTVQGKKVYHYACKIINEMDVLENMAARGMTRGICISMNPSSWLANQFVDFYNQTYEKNYHFQVTTAGVRSVMERVRDYLDDIRANLPGELRQAQQIVNDRAQIVDTANAQAQAIVKKAEERARILVSDAEIVKAAQQRAAEITAAAQSESRTLRQTVTDYCDNMLKTTEEAMVENAAQVKNVRANLRQNAKKNG